MTDAGTTPPPLAMDGRMLAPGGTGVSSYARELGIAQAAIAGRSLALVEDAAVAPPCRSARWLRAAWPGPLRATRSSDAIVARDVFRLAQVFFDIHRRPLPLRLPGAPGIVHWTYPLPIVVPGWTNLYTVHDAIPLTAPTLTPIDPRRHRRLLDALTPHAAGFVTVSQAAKREIVAALGCDPGFVHDCGEAVAPERSDAALPAGLRPGGYLLAVGSVETRKNLARLIDGHRASGSRLPLVIAGPDGWGAAALAERLATPGILRLPYLPEPVIRALIGAARALLMPSLAEGFGLPVAEAMALGTPVLTSRGGALEETAGGAALLVDPTDVDAIAAAIRRLTDDDMLCRDLAAAGGIRAAAFTRARFRERLADLYRRFGWYPA